MENQHSQLVSREGTLPAIPGKSSNLPVQDMPTAIPASQAHQSAEIPAPAQALTSDVGHENAIDTNAASRKAIARIKFEMMDVFRKEKNKNLTSDPRAIQQATFRATNFAQQQFILCLAAHPTLQDGIRSNLEDEISRNSSAENKNMFEAFNAAVTERRTTQLLGNVWEKANDARARARALGEQGGKVFCEVARQEFLSLHGGPETPSIENLLRIWGSRHPLNDDVKNMINVFNQVADAQRQGKAKDIVQEVREKSSASYYRVVNSIVPALQGNHLLRDRAFMAYRDAAHDGFGAYREIDPRILAHVGTMLKHDADKSPDSQRQKEAGWLLQEFERAMRPRVENSPTVPGVTR